MSTSALNLSTLVTFSLGIIFMALTILVPAKVAWKTCPYVPLPSSLDDRGIRSARECSSR